MAGSAAKKLRGRSAKKPAPVLEAGKAKDPSSYVVIDNPEATVASYCGFIDIATFRHFYLSPHVLPFFVKSLAFKSALKRRTLLLLEDAPYDTSWASGDDPCTLYPQHADLSPQELKSNANYGLGLVVWQMLRDLRKGGLREIDTASHDSFTEETGCKMPKLLPFPPDSLPDFGPFEGETDLEPLNRCMCLFAHMKHATHKSQWERRFFGSTSWDTSILIPEDYVPDWMRRTDTSMVDDVQLPDKGSSNVRGPRSIPVEWRYKSKNPTNREFVESAGPKGTNVLEKIPKEAVVTFDYGTDGYRSRDKVREAFSLDIYGAQLWELTLFFPANEEEGEDWIPALDDWSAVRDAIWSHDQDAGLRFSILLCCRDEDESPWESRDPPFKSFLEAKESDGVTKQDISTEKKEEAHHQGLGMTMPTPENPFQPLNLFGHDEDGMRDLSGGHDVSTQEGQQDWQPTEVQTYPIRLGKKRPRSDVEEFESFTK